MSRSTRSNLESAQVHVYVEAKGQDEHVLHVLGRAPTHLGDQGDHVSAHQLIVNAAHAVVEGVDLEVACVKAFHLMDMLQSKVQHYIKSLNDESNAYDEQGKKIPEFLEELGDFVTKRNNEFTLILSEMRDKFNENKVKYINLNKYNEIISDLFVLGKENQAFNDKHGDLNFINKLEGEIKDLVILANRSRKYEELEKDVIKIIKKYLTIRNKLPFTAFPVEGNIEPPQGEGARVRKAAGKLKLLERNLQEEIEKVKELLKSDSDELIDWPKHVDYNQFTLDIASAMFELFWYPKIPRKILIDLDTKSGKDKWEKIMEEKGYTIGTRPRDNNPKILYEVTANHIDLVLTCHPRLTFDQSFVNQIIKQFVQLVAQNGNINGVAAHWGMSKAHAEEFYKIIIDKLKVEHMRHDDLVQDWASSNESSTQTTPVSSGNITPQGVDSRGGSPNTSGIMARLSTPATPPMTLAKLADPNTATPQSTASDISYVDEEESPNDNNEDEKEQNVKTRSQSGPLPSEQLEDRLNKLKFGK